MFGDIDAEAQGAAPSESFSGLVYFFAPGDVRHQQRAERLGQLIAGSGIELNLAKIDQLQVWLGSLDILGRDGIGPSAVGDLLLWVGDELQPSRTLAYDQVSSLLADEPVMVATEVDESTWGKVKELFR